MRRKTRLGLAAVIVVAALGFLLANGLRHFTEYYLTIPQLQAQRAALGSSSVRVAGVVIGKSVVYKPQSQYLSFKMRGGSKDIRVVYRGPEPDTFGAPDVQAIADGHLQPDGTFLAQSLLMKCPSHYQPATPTTTPSGSNGNQG
ncbi:MAG: cytochrome c maturation protein CcmE [Thermaerobacter sp.]|nr:cytochrome c maturation protein CcmE [Thermaerobacter sp.]